MKAKIRAILEKYGIDNYHWKPEITKELVALFKEELNKKLKEQRIADSYINAELRNH